MFHPNQCDNDAAPASHAYGHTHGEALSSICIPTRAGAKTLSIAVGSMPRFSRIAFGKPGHAGDRGRSSVFDASRLSIGVYDVITS
jgi:hypothetical protein